VTAPKSTLDGPVQQGTGADEILLSVVIPCLNEADSIAIVVRKALETMQHEGIAGEVGGRRQRLDGRFATTRRRRRRPRGGRAAQGYGSAYLAGFAAARGRYIVMGDADDTYDFTEIGRFVGPLQEGADLVMGNRMSNIHPGAMPWLHRYVGNPVLTGVLNLFFKTGVSDAHCGMRGFRRDLLPALDLRTTGMEFASEHVIRSSKLGLDIRQIDIDYHPRRGESKLSSFSDGWRHLRFLLVHSPTWLFVVPGALMLVLGLLAAAVTLSGLELFGREWQLHAMIGAVLLATAGAQVLQIGGFARVYAAYYLGEHDKLLDTLRGRLRLEHGLVAGALLLLAGSVIVGAIAITWLQRGLGELREEKLALAGVTLVVLGMQSVFGAFFISVLGLHRRPRPSDELLEP
jgi:hypothetical protein